MLQERADRLVEAVRAIKADDVTPVLFREFLARTERGGTLDPGEAKGAS